MPFPLRDPKDWPPDGLESVTRCPVCGADEREPLHRDLADLIFRCAPGRWTLHRCLGCDSAYLDPRPTPATVGLAYARYFTHAPPAETPGGPVKRFKEALANGYRSHAFGSDFHPASHWGVLAARLLPWKKAMLDAEARGLSPPPPGESPSVLDIGCGDGTFLRLARRMGWKAFGVEPDDKAAAVAASHGAVILGRFSEDLTESYQGAFDAATLNHVVEHAHDPPALLRTCRRLLRPGGRLWVETPNIHSPGHRRYGRFWRGLDPPRHLALFNRASLILALTRAGFTDIEDFPHRPLCLRSFALSEAVRQGRDPYAFSKPGLPLRVRALLCDLLESLRPRLREFTTLQARSASIDP